MDYRNRRDRERADRPIKMEPRSRSRSPARNEFIRPSAIRRPDREEDDRRRRSRDEPSRGGGSRSSSSDSRSHEPKRERRSDREEDDRRNNRRSRDEPVRGGSRSSDIRADRPIKIERRSRSRSPARNEFIRPSASRPRPDREEDDRRRNNRRSRDEPVGGSSRGLSSNERPREPKRERDWDNFFNPESEMSREALVKREMENAERESRIQNSESGSGGGGGGDDENKKNVEKEKPNFGLSGKLTEETNTYRGVVIKYSEPPEARKPIKTRWRLYPFKDGEALEVMFVHRQSAYLLGRERKIADIPIDHPSCSKQHAVLQYRLVPYERPNGMKGRRIRPYVIDLESANGTYVNGNRIEAKRYVELFEKDVLKFGFSSREYVLLHEHSQDDDPLDDDGLDKSPTPD